MIKVYSLYDLSVNDLNALIERGECFNVTSTVLSPHRGDGERDAFWSDRDDSSTAVQESDKRESNI